MSAHTHTHTHTQYRMNLFCLFISPIFPLPIFVSYFCVCNPAFGKQNKSLIVCVCVCVGRIFPLFSFDVSLSALFLICSIQIYHFTTECLSIIIQRLYTFITYIFIQRYYCYCAYVSVCFSTSL